MTQLETYKTQFKELLGALEGEKSLPLRQKSFDHFLDSGLPIKKMEDWKYTDLSPLSKNHTPFKSDIIDFDGELPKKITPWPRLVYINGRLSKKCSDKIDFRGIAFANQQQGHKPKPQEGLTALNKALAIGGINLNIGKETDIEGLEILNVFSGNSEEVIHIQNNITLEKGVHFSIFTQNLCPNAIGWVNMTSSITVPNNSSLTQINDLKLNPNSFFTFDENVSLKGGEYENHSILMETGSARHLINIDVEHENSRAILNGAFLAGEHETLDTLTRLNHLVPNSNSEQFYRGVLKKGGKTAFQGKVVVKTDAQKTVANQSCKNLMLDRNSEANVKPELLIFADDVKCAHGATVGELDREAYFYLLQRGLEPSLAHGLLVNAFLGEIIEAIPNDNLKVYFEEVIHSWMKHSQEEAPNDEL